MEKLKKKKSKSGSKQASAQKCPGLGAAIDGHADFQQGAKGTHLDALIKNLRNLVPHSNMKIAATGLASNLYSIISRMVEEYPFIDQSRHSWHVSSGSNKPKLLLTELYRAAQSLDIDKPQRTVLIDLLQCGSEVLEPAFRVRVQELRPKWAEWECLLESMKALTGLLRDQRLNPKTPITGLAITDDGSAVDWNNGVYLPEQLAAVLKGVDPGDPQDAGGKEPTLLKKLVDEFAAGDSDDGGGGGGGGGGGSGGGGSQDKYNGSCGLGRGNLRAHASLRSALELAVTAKSRTLQCLTTAARAHPAALTHAVPAVGLEAFVRLGLLLRCLDPPLGPGQLRADSRDHVLRDLYLSCRKAAKNDRRAEQRAVGQQQGKYRAQQQAESDVGAVAGSGSDDETDEEPGLPPPANALQYRAVQALLNGTAEGPPDGECLRFVPAIGMCRATRPCTD